MIRFIAGILVLIGMVGSARCQEATLIPYRLTRTQHILVRCKIDGKGPFHFVIDTGCPVLVISKEAAKKAGLVDEKGSAILGKLEFEGGLAQEKVKARVETPFQIEGMNNMGLPGIELHGLMGYTVLAKYKMEFDFTKSEMKWTPLKFDPPPLLPVAMKGGTGGIEMMGGLIKLLSALSGLKPDRPAEPRGFVGVMVEPREKRLVVTRVLKGSPAAEAGLLADDVLESINGRAVQSPVEVEAAVGELRVGGEVSLGILRGDEKQTIKLKAGQGL